MKSLISIVVSLFTATGVHSAELQLRDQGRTTGPLVLVGDIAEIHARHSVEAADLAAIDLFPAPPAGESRVLRLREVQDLLAIRGVNLALHRFSGASQVTLHGPSCDTRPEKSSASSRAGRAVRQVPKEPVEEATRTAVQAWLNETAGEQEWQVTLTLSDALADAIANLGDSLKVAGGAAPFTGEQQFLVSAENSDATPITVAAEVAIPPAIVVARHSLPKGVILRADDVKLQRGLPTKGDTEVYTSIADVAGKETTRTIAEGQILDSRSVRRQLLVRRSEIVTLYARAAGVSVRTTARVRDDGALGDLVRVETLQDRKPLFARVFAPQEVEVFAQAISAAEPGQHATNSIHRIPSRGTPLAPLPAEESVVETAPAERNDR